MAICSVGWPGLSRHRWEGSLEATKERLPPVSLTRSPDSPEEGLAKLARVTRLGGVGLFHLALRPIILAPERSYAVRGQRDEATRSEANGIDRGASRLRRGRCREGRLALTRELSWLRVKGA